MAETNQNVLYTRSAVLDTDVAGGLLLPSSATLPKDAATFSSVDAPFLKPGQGVLVGAETFTVDKLAGTAVTVNKASRVGYNGVEVYTDGNLLNLKNIDGQLLFSVDAAGHPVHHNGTALPLPVATALTVDHVRAGAAVINDQTPAGDVALVLKPAGDTGPELASKLGREGTLHSFVLVNATAAPRNVTWKTAKVATVPANAAIDVRLFVKTTSPDGHTDAVLVLPAAAGTVAP